MENMFFLVELSQNNSFVTTFHKIILNEVFTKNKILAIGIKSSFIWTKIFEISLIRNVFLPDCQEQNFVTSSI